jgi:hypothetical protein
MHAIRVNSDRSWLRNSCGRDNIGNPGAANAPTGGRSTGGNMGVEDSVAKNPLPDSRRGGYCEMAKHLLEEFGEAVSVVLRFHQEQFNAIMEGDGDAGRFDVLIHQANEGRQNAKYAYLNHVHLHGCSANKWNF